MGFFDDFLTTARQLAWLGFVWSGWALFSLFGLCLVRALPGPGFALIGAFPSRGFAWLVLCLVYLPGRCLAWSGLYLVGALPGRALAWSGLCLVGRLYLVGALPDQGLA